MWSVAAFFLRIATRVSTSGAGCPRSAHWNRLRSRSSNPSISWQLVGGDEDLLAGFVQGVEGVEELLHVCFLLLRNWMSSSSKMSHFSR